jgi:hypothetical protein
VGTFGVLRAALAVAGVILSPALLLNGRAIRHGGVEPVLEEARKEKGHQNIAQTSSCGTRENCFR